MSDFANNDILRFGGTTGAFLGVFASGGGLEEPNQILFTPVPEPASVALMGLSLPLWLAFAFRRRAALRRAR